MEQPYKIRVVMSYCNKHLHRGLIYRASGFQFGRVNEDGVSSYDSKGEEDKAIADYTEAIRIDPNLTQAYGGRGASYDAKGDHKRAIADYTEAIRLDPTEPIFYVARAMAYRALGDEAKGASDEKKAKELNK